MSRLSTVAGPYIIQPCTTASILWWETFLRCYAFLACTSCDPAHTTTGANRPPTMQQHGKSHPRDGESKKWMGRREDENAQWYSQLAKYC